MAVGTLNVAVTASTRKAQQELQAFRNRVREVGAEVKRASKDFGGNTIADFTKKFGGSGSGGKPPVDDLNSYRSAVVDLSAETNRYRGLSSQLNKDAGLLKGLKKGLGDMKGLVAGALAVPAAAVIGFKFGQGVGNALRRGYQGGIAGMKKEATSLLESIFDPDLVAARERNLAGQQAAAQTATEKKLAAEEAAAQKKAGIDARLAEDQFRLRSATVGEDQAIFERDEKDLGRNEALRLLEARQAANFAELEIVKKKEAAEAKAAAAKEKEKKIAEEAERKRKNQLKDEQAVAALRRDVAEFGMTSVQRQRAALMRSIEDPRLRSQARGLFAQQDAQQQSVAARNRIKLLAQTGSMGLSATDANSREGFAQRIRFGNQNRVDKIASDQLKTQRQMEAHLRTLAGSPSADFEPANIGGG